ANGDIFVPGGDGNGYIVRVNPATGNGTIVSSGGFLSFPQGMKVVPASCDVNKDGVVNVLDVQLIANQVLGVIPATSDINGDGAVNVLDLQLGVNAALGLGCKP